MSKDAIHDRETSSIRASSLNKRSVRPHGWISCVIASLVGFASSPAVGAGSARLAPYTRFKRRRSVSGPVLMLWA
jgi:hypothetical protein